MWNFFKNSSKRRRGLWDPATPLFEYIRGEPFTNSHAWEHIHLWGSTGCGKTTGSFARYSEAACMARYSGIFLCVKVSDAENYLRRCERTGRLSDVVMFGPDQPHRYNPFDAEMQRTDAGGRSTQSIVQLLMSLLEVSQPGGSSQDTGENAGYFKAMTEQLLTCSIDLLRQAGEEISVPTISDIVSSLPTSREQAESEKWQKNSYCWECLQRAAGRPKAERDRYDLRLNMEFFLRQFAELSSKTRASVVSKFSSLVDSLQRGMIRELISGRSTITPEMVLREGKIVIVNTPPKLHGVGGIFVNVLWKIGMQQALERRTVSEETRPAFIACDESHLLAVESDAVFQTTARSSRCMVLNSSQSWNNYIAKLGPHSEAAVMSFLGCHQTHVFHQQSDTKMNSYASELIGQTKRFSVTFNKNFQHKPWSVLGDEETGSSYGMNEAWEPTIQASAFTHLAKGGAPHYTVDGIVYQGGRKFRTTGEPWMLAKFRQKF